MNTADDKTTTRDLLFAGTHGHVVAIEKGTGETVWATSLPRTGYSVVSIVVEDGLLLCASGGRVFGLDPSTGRIEWSNDMPKLGSGLVYLATERSSGAGGMEVLAAQAAAQAAAAAAG